MNTSLILETEAASKSERTAVMDVQNITKSLPPGRERIDILKGISFQIMSGEFVSIVGPSGSGKSTLLGIIAGLDNPTTGQVLIDGVDITRMSEGKLAAVRNSKIGMVFQAFNLIPTLTARVVQELRGARRDMPNLFTDLSDRELEVLRLIADGLSNAEIASKLVISEKTVKGHVSNILGKLHMMDRTQATVYAWQQGLVARRDP